jgi:hypothetical protein
LAPDAGSVVVVVMSYGVPVAESTRICWLVVRTSEPLKVPPASRSDVVIVLANGSERVSKPEPYE